MGEHMVNLSFENSQTIEKAEEIKKQILSAMSDGQTKISLDLSAVKKVDLSFLQILYSAGLEAIKRNIEIPVLSYYPL